MKTKLLIILTCSALTGWVIAANKDSAKADAEIPAADSGPKPPAPKPPEPKPPAPKPPQPKDPSPQPPEPKEPAPKPPASTDAEAAPEPKAAPLITSDLGGRDLQFLSSAFEQGQIQLYLGELAKTRAGTEQVKAVGEVLSSTQAEENKKVARLAAMKGISLIPGESAGQKALETKLGKLTGPKLDKVLMEEIVNVNQQAVAVYQAASATKDEDIKAFVSQGLPLAKEKLFLANKMNGNAPRTDQTPGFRTNTAAPETR